MISKVRNFFIPELIESGEKKIGPLSGFLIFLFFLYLITSPFYIIKSGYPQPADFILSLAMGLGFLSFLVIKKIKINEVYLIGIIFSIHAFFINIINNAFYPDIRFILTSLIYIYNIGAFIFTCFLIEKYPRTIINLIYYGVILTIISQFLFVHFIPSHHPFRATGTFNNPNQLAYWVLLTSAIILTIKYKTKLNLLDYFLLFILFYIQMLSLSKAGIITLSLLYMLCFSVTIFKSKYRFFLVGLLGFTVIVIAINFSNSNADLSHFETIKKAVLRISSIGEERDDSLEGRGYTRLIENPIYLIFGSGEGAFWRHKGGGHDQELHSGLATLFFSYGFVGVLIFCLFIFQILKKNPPLVVVIFILVMMFGFTHQNLRFSLYWVFLSLMCKFPLLFSLPLKERHKI